MELINQLATVNHNDDNIACIDDVVINPTDINNSLLQRLIEEVKNDSANNIFAYDRSHNRHNRGR